MKIGKEEKSQNFKFQVLNSNVLSNEHKLRRRERFHSLPQNVERCNLMEYYERPVFNYTTAPNPVLGFPHEKFIGSLFFIGIEVQVENIVRNLINLEPPYCRKENRLYVGHVDFVSPSTEE